MSAPGRGATVLGIDRYLKLVMLVGVLVLPDVAIARDAVRDNARWPVTQLQAQRATRWLHRHTDAGDIGPARNIRCRRTRRGAVCLYDFHRGDDGSEWANSDSYDQPLWVHALGPTHLRVGVNWFRSDFTLRRR